jgi:segregation and condensation protein B
MMSEENVEQVATSEPESEPAESEPAESALIGDGPAADDVAVADTGAFLKGLIEALVFVSDKPLELKEIARGARIDRARATELIEEIQREYAERGLCLTEVAGGFAFRSNPLYAERLRHYLSLRPTRLSRAQLETLAIVAYRQPITRPEIDDIRGVDSGPVLKGLLERDLVRIIGKKDEPGRPMLYGTTPSFLEAFSLKSLRDLPTLREYTELSEESRQTFESELGEAAPEGPIETTAPPASESVEALADAMGSVVAHAEGAPDAAAEERADSEEEGAASTSTDAPASESAPADDDESDDDDDDDEADDDDDDEADDDEDEADDDESDDDEDDDEDDDDKDEEKDK